MKNNVVFSHVSDNWRTPSILFNALVFKYKYIDLFPYCSKWRI